MLCSQVARFVLKHDHRHLFRFAPLQGTYAQALMAHSDGQIGLDSVCVVLNPHAADQRVVTRSDAVIAIVGELGWSWRVGSRFLRWIPRLLRDWLYDVVAKHRYQIFGRHQTCIVPDLNDADRFLL